MGTKTVKFYFQVSGTTGDTPASVTITGGDAPVTASLAHTKDWVANSTNDGARTMDISVTIADLPTSSVDAVLQHKTLTIVPTGGDILLCGITRDYTVTSYTANPAYNSALPISPENRQGTITSSGATFAMSNIMAQPLINGTADLTRYDISGHTAGGSDGTMGLGNLPIQSGETATIVMDVGYYRA